jgi:FG-GAP-like repeat/Subtilase family
MIRLALATLAAGVALSVPAMAADPFPQGPPNDPAYAPGGQQPGDCADQPGQWPLFSTIPGCYPHAKDPEGAAGMSIDTAWRRYTIGDPRTVIAYIEGGVDWRSASARDLVDKVYLNTRELPLPQRADGSACTRYDCNGDGAVSASDYAHDPRVKDVNGNGYVDPEDLIVAFSDRRDDDRNGYVDDISGWNFATGGNDPATDEIGYTHGNSQSRVAAAQTNNGFGGAGICPRCQVMFVKSSAEALPLPERQAQAFLYAVDQGVSAIISETVALSYSTFQKQALEYAWKKGVVVAADSSDFDSAAHTDGMFWPHVLPGQSVVQQAEESGSPDTTSFREHSNITSRGPRSMLAFTTDGGSSSETDPTVAGVAGLLASYGRERAARPSAPRGAPRGPLSAGEITQLLIVSASPIVHRTDPHLGWPAPKRSSWSYYYGYGRPNVAKALGRVKAGRIPPVPDITSPSWYQLLDPATAPRRLRIDGTISARRARSARYVVEYGLGPEPADNAWHRLRSRVGTVRGVYSGPLATLDLRTIPRSFFTKRYRNTGGRRPGSYESQDQFALTLRVRVVDDRGLRGVDRRAIYLHHDPAAQRGWPRRQSASGESQPALADLDGDGRAEIVVGNSDGQVHAYRADGRELPGWPVRTGRVRSVAGHRAAPAYRHVRAPNAAITAPVAVGDLNGDGRLDVVAQTADGRVYAWDARGRRLRGFPVRIDRFATRAQRPSRQVYGRPATAGSVSAPVLADLDRDGRREIVAASFDGHLYAIRADGSDKPGWPVAVRPSPEQVREGEADGARWFDDQRLIATPAVGDITGDGRPEVVIGGTGGFITGGKGGGAAERLVFAVQADGNRAPGGPFAPGWPVTLHDAMGLHGGFDYLTDFVPSVALAPLHGAGRLDVIASAPFAAPTVIDGTGRALTQFAVASKKDPALTFSGAGALARSGGRWQWFSSAVGVDSLMNAIFGSQGVAAALYNWTRGYDPLTGTPLPGFPRVQQGMGLFNEPATADVDGDGRPEALVGTDTMTLHAFRPGGGEAAGFPKFTGGWLMHAPTVGDLDGDGRAEVVFTTREGYLHVLRTKGRARDAQWCHWQGDAANTGVASASCPLPRSKRGSRGRG